MNHIKKIIVGYQAVLKTICFFLAIAGFCLFLGLIIVYPFWRLAIVNRSLYTILCLSIVTLFLIKVVTKKIITAYKKDSRALYISLARGFVLWFGLICSLMLVLSFHKFLALGVFILTLVIHGFLAFSLSHQSKTNGE